MGFDYSLAQEPLKLGEYDEKFGQSYWATVNEHLQPVKFNSKSQTIGVNDKITAEERSEKRSGKGTDYFQLRGVKVEAVNKLSKEEAQKQEILSPTQLDRIEAKIDRLLGEEPKEEIYDRADPIITDIGEGEIVSLDSIPF